MDVNYLAEYLPVLLEATKTTAVLTVITLVLSTLIALPLSVAGVWKKTRLSACLDVFTLFMRSIPTLVILFFFYYGMPQLGLVLPAFTVAVVGLTLSAVAYNIEILRAGLRAVDAGQIEAAQALGIPRWRIWVNIAFPQALPIFLPTYLSNATLVLKGTSVASIITIPELTAVANEIVSLTYQPFEILIASAIIYIIMGGVLSLIAAFVRQRLGARSSPLPQPEKVDA
jgi:His/Glu/Gln/Arg/opine family amino acid ABC transporter permease subunit